MKRVLMIFQLFVMSVLPVLAEDEVPWVSSSIYHNRVELNYPQPLVSLTVVGNGSAGDDRAMSEKDLGRDLFTITGSDAHQPITRWSDQDELSITFPEGTSCATEYTFQLKPGTCYLGGEAAPTNPVKFRCPPDRLHGRSFMDERGLGVMVCPEKYLTRESREFSTETPLRFVFRKPRQSFWSGKTYYVGCVEGVVEPACLKQGLSSTSLRQLQMRGEKHWRHLGEKSPLPGHIVVRPARSLDPDEEWHLLVLPEEGQGFSDDLAVCSNVELLPELGTGVEWESDAAGGYRLKVRFSNPMSTVDMPKILDRMQLAAGANEATAAGTGRKKLKLDGRTVEFRYAGVLPVEGVQTGGVSRTLDSGKVEELAPLRYEPQGQCMGFVVEVSATAPVLLDVVLPADVQSYLGFKAKGAHRHRIALNPAWPVLRPGNRNIIPLRGDRCLRLPAANVAGVQVQAWKLAHEMTATAFGHELSDTATTAACKLEYDLLNSREWRGMENGEYALESAENRLDNARDEQRRAAARSRKVLKGATEFPGCRLPGLAAGMLQSGELVLRLDDALGSPPVPGMYLLRLTNEANTQVRSALRMLERDETSLNTHRDLLVQVTDLNVTLGRDAVLVNRYSDGRPVESGTVSWMEGENEHRQVKICNGIAWLPEDWGGCRKVWVRSGDDVVMLQTPWCSRGYEDADSSSGKASTMLVLDRPIYRPGDEVNVRGVLRRQLKDGSCAIPDCKAARVTLCRPDGSELENRELPLGEFGAFESSFTLPTGEDDVTGRYELRVEAGDFTERAEVNCQVFRRDAFKTSLEIDIDPVAPEAFTLRVSAVDYSGTPLAGARCRLEIAGAEKEVGLDAGGKAAVTCPVTAEMRETGSVSVSGSVVNDREEYVKLRELRQPIYTADFRIELSGNRIKLFDCRTGKPLDREQVVQLRLVEDKEIIEAGRNGLGFVRPRPYSHWSGSVTVPANCELGQPLPVNLDDWRGKAEALIAGGLDADGRICERKMPIWRYSRTDNAPPELKASASEGAVELLADLPYSCHAHVLVGCGQKLRHLTLPVQAGKHAYRVPLAEGEEGSLSFTLVLPAQAPGGEPICASAECFVPIRQYHLDVALQLPQQICRPAEIITISGRVLAGGSPVDAEVTLYAVDAGMLSVGCYEYPDPESFFCSRSVRSFSLTRSMHHGYRRESALLRFMPAFWRGDMVGAGYSLTPGCSITRKGMWSGISRKSKRALARAAELPPWLLNEQYQYADSVAPAPCVTAVKAGSDAEEEEEADSDSPADASELAAQPRLRTNFAPVAVWKGALRTDAEGSFSAEVTLPDTLTTYEVIAVAVDKSGKRFGEAKGEFTVAQPVMLTPGTPLFMSLGDELRLPLSIVNNTDEAGTWTVTLEGAEAPQQITLEPRCSGTLFFDFKAATEGDQKLCWTALGKPGSDAVQGEFVVRFPAPVLKEVHRLTLSPGEAAVQLSTLLGSDAGTATRGELELVASANPLLHLAGVADFLLEYPYGCTEQRASALIPWLLYEHLAPFCPKMAQTRPDVVRKVVQKAIADLLPRQCADGGLAYWGGWNHSSLWATAHAGYVLKLAQEMGYDLPQGVMDKLYRYLWWASTSGESARTRFAIARTRGKTGQMKDILREMLDEDEEHDWLSRETKSSMQFMLSILENPSGADAAFRTWMRTVGRDYRHGCTQSNAWTLLALVEYLNLKKEQRGEASLTLQDGSLISLGKGATVVPLSWQPGQEMKSLTTALAAVNGTVYATLKVRALPATTDFPGVTERGLQVTRLYETQGGDGIWRPATSFKVGDVVRVTLTCAKVADELKYLVLEDYLPACMEAINPHVPSQSAGLPALAWSRWFDHREYLADRVRGFCTRWESRELLNMRYYARVKRAGTSSAPPAQAQLMYEPQVYGLSPNARITSEP